MERLTFDGLFCDIAKCENTPGGTFCEAGTCTIRRVLERLKEYEDTGMEPEDLKKAFNESAILKPGDTVYQIDAERVYASEVKRIIYDAGHIAFDERAIGKTVFLTREEAEAALAKEGASDGKENT